MTQGDLWAAAEALLAFRRAENSSAAMVGALIEAEDRANLRAIVRSFLK